MVDNIDIEDAFPDGRWSSSSEYCTTCPFCGDGSHNHMYINVEKSAFHCFYCGESGGLGKLMAKIGYRSSSIIFKGAVQSADSNQVVPIFDFRSLYSIQPSDTDLWHYLMYKRHMSATEIVSYRVGCDRWVSRLYRRVVFPVFEAGQPVCYSARAISDITKPKYLFPSRGETVLTASDCIFGFDEADIDRGPGWSLVVVEGIFDAIRVNRLEDKLGVPVCAVALMGKRASAAQIQKLLCLFRSGEYENVVVMLDVDARKDNVQLAHSLQPLISDVCCAFVHSKDPDSCGDDELLDALKNVTDYSLDLYIQTMCGGAKSRV